MLSPFYKIVAQQLQAFFVAMSEKQEIGRYYLELPSEEYVENIYTALSELKEAQPFVCQGEKQIKPYETIAIHVNGFKYVIASTMKNTHVDFLVTLRNEMSEQKGQWSNTSIVMISNKKLDSIAGGSISLTAEGFPLHSSKIVSGISNEVDDSILSAEDKRILKHYLARQNSGQQFKNVSFLDFENLLKWLNQEKMEAEDYKFIGYFPDPHIATLTTNLSLYTEGSNEYKKAKDAIDKAIEKRLDANTNLFEEVARIRELGDEERIFKEKFDETIGKKLLRDDEMLSYEDLIQAQEKVNSKKEISYKAHEVKMWTVEGESESSFQDFWKLESRLRTHDFILFVPGLKATEVIRVKLPFTARTSDAHAHIKKAKGASTKSSGYSLEVVIPYSEESNFVHVNYKHEDTTKFNFTFRFLVLPIEPLILEKHKSNYSLTTRGNLLLELKDEKLQLGDDTTTKIEIKNSEEIVELQPTGAELSFSPDSLEKESTKIEFKFKIQNVIIQCEVEDEVLGAPTYTNTQLWQRKIKQQVSVEYTSFDQRMLLADKPFVTRKESRKFFELEQQWLDENWTCAVRQNTNYVEGNIPMCEELQGSYEAFLQYFRDHQIIPSFAFYDEELIFLADNYINSYIKCIDSIENNRHMPSHVKSILYLGSVVEENTIFMSPFSPLNVAYQLAIVKELAGEEVNRQILNKLNAGFSIPYLVGPKNEIYKPVSNLHQAEWHEYRLKDYVSIGETNEYLAKVVKEKLNQFTSYYSYLFDLSDEAELIINVVNIENDEEILRGIVEWFKERMKKHTSLINIPYVKVVGYFNNESTLSAFEHFSVLTKPTILFEQYEINCKVAQFEEIDVFHEIQKHLAFIKKPLNEKRPSFGYSHLTFYHMLTDETISTQTVQQAPNAMNLEGLYVTPVSKRTEDGGYRVGFGIGESNHNRTQLTKFITKINEMSANRRNGGTDVYQKDIMLCLHMNAENEAFLEALYDSCIWLVFIDPVVDLTYFQKTMDDVIIVHYSDQLSSSTGYDAITVTNKSEQYYRVIEEFLSSVGILLTKEQIIQTIMAFNTFNGEWLLRAVQGKGYDSKEKVSVVAAIKYMLVYLKDKKPNTLWVPISMEEVLRVAGNIGISKKDGIFSHKIASKGKMSDDLLFIGLQFNDEQKLEFLFHPVEVKIGQNSNAVIDTAVQQLTNLNKLLAKEITNEGFEAKFIRNFFAKLFISNATKMNLNKFYPEENYILSENNLELLLNDEFIVRVSNEPIGTALSFKAGEYQIKHDLVSDVHIFEVPANLAYKAVGLPISSIAQDDYSDIQEIEVVEEATYEIDELPQTVNSLSGSKEEDRQIYSKTLEADNHEEGLEGDRNKRTEEQFEEEPGAVKQELKEHEEGTDKESIEQEEQEEQEEKLVNKTVKQEVKPNQTQTMEEVAATFDLTGIRPIIGHTLSTHEPVHWEFGHKTLSNRHMVIGGRSGEGKTYFIQSMIKQLIEQGQSVIIIDYSASYTKQKLNANFLKALGDRVVERVVFDDKLPINPLRQREFKTELDTYRLEKSFQVAGRVKEIFERIFDFGPQQSSAIYAAIRDGIDLYGQNFNLKKMINMLRDSENLNGNTLASIINKLQQFIDIDPFDYDDSFTWDEYFKKPGQLTIIQFAGFDQDNIKKLMTELLLWDIWYYAQRGTETQPLPIVLDEAQNLGFRKESPSEKILREGRKFGISAWFATQSFNTFKTEELTVLENAPTAIYFKPLDSDFKTVATKLRLQKNDQHLIDHLKIGQCFAKVKIINKYGELIESVKMVQVPPME